jgi:hypothetical protein
VLEDYLFIRPEDPAGVPDTRSLSFFFSSEYNSDISTDPLSISPLISLSV